MEGLSYYNELGWVVHVFPLVVGIWGMIESSHVESLLKFLDIQRKHWLVAIEQTALASVQAFHFLHKVRFGGPLERVQLDMDPNSISSASEDDIDITTKRKHQTTSKHFSGVDWDSDSHEHVRLSQSPYSQTSKKDLQMRRPQHTSPTDAVLAAEELEPFPPALLTRQTPNLVHSTTAIRNQALNSRIKPRCTVKRKTRAPAEAEEGNRIAE